MQKIFTLITLTIIILLLLLYLFNSKYFNEKYDMDKNLINNESNNCYAYAFNDINLNKSSKPQPGFKHNLKPLKKTEYTCENFIKRVLLDNPNSIYLGKNPKYNDYNCGDKNHLVFLALDNEGENRDYHFYKKNDNEFWSHKPGSLPINYFDASNNLIINPYYADRNYRDFQYTINCGFFCTSN